MHSILKAIAFVFLTTATSISFARCEETIPRLPDGRYLESPKDKQSYFAVSTPPGTRPFDFYLEDLLRDPDRYAPRLRLSEWSSLSTGSSVNHPHEIIGVHVEKGVNKVGIHSGVDNNYEAWRPEWAHHREMAADMPADQYGWIRQDAKSPTDQTIFIKFLDAGDRLRSRYYALSCGYFGSCSLRAHHDNFTHGFRFTPQTNLAARTTW